jgi:hypothetical protein
MKWKGNHKMQSYRTNSVIVGILFILGTAAGVSAAVIETPLLNASDYLAKLSANAGQITAGAFLQFLMAMSCAGIGISLYPIIKQYHQGLAVAVAGFRGIEGTLQVIGGIATISFLSLSQEFAKAAVVDQAYFQSIGTMLKDGSNWLNNGPMPLSWCIAAVMYYLVFYRYQLVPRWLSAWGLVGITLTIVSSVLITLNVITTVEPLQSIANLPIAVQEMVFAVWLIVKGYSPSTTQRQPALSQVCPAL